MSNLQEVYMQKKQSDGRWFLLTSILSLIFFVLFGIYELLFKSPLASWAQGIWQSTLKASPQSLTDLPAQIINSESLMQKTIGDWLGFLPGTFGEIWAIISSPAGAVIGIVLVFLAMVIRLVGRFFFRSRPNFNKLILKIVSWATLGASFLPLLFEYTF